jgi:predicted P-loop ATPase
LAVARFRQYHPIRDDLARVRHDGKPRLDSWLVRHAGAEDSAYVRAVGRKFLIQMVARVMQPGCKADHTLVLSGPQGQNKSTACRILAGAEYFSETLPSITGDKTDAIRHLQGKWLVELAELAPSRKSESEDLKAFLSGAIDRVRLPYARLDQSFPRQCVFVGTTNEDQFLRDATGGRRFWPVPVRQVIDIVALAAERDQLLAEATAAFNAGEPWWLDRDFEAEHARPMQEAAFVSDGWADAVAAWLDKTEEDFDGTTRTRDVDFHPELSRFFHREVSHL